MDQVIVAKLVPDWLEPYKGTGSFIPLVTTSTDPKYDAGTRFDWGTLQIALEAGFTVLLLPPSRRQVRQLDAARRDRRKHGS